MHAPTDLKAVLLTTYNRPKLLGQCLGSIARQAHELGVPLVIQDDGSTDPETIKILGGIAGYPWVLVRSRGERGHGSIPHLSTGENFLDGLRFLLEEFGDDGVFIKVDDDVFLQRTALTDMRDTWQNLSELGPICLSALVEQNRTYRDVKRVSVVETGAGACSICCLHRLDLWKQMIEDVPTDVICAQGWDNAFFLRGIGKKRRHNYFGMVPARAYHAGHLGVHGFTDVNRMPTDPMSFPGIWSAPDGGRIRPEGCRIETGDVEQWRANFEAQKVGWQQ